MFGRVDTPLVQPLDAAVDDVAAVDSAILDDATLADALVELRRVRARLAAVEARLVEAVDTRRHWATDDFRSTANWLAYTDNTALGDARDDIRLARRLRTMPATAAALAAGDITDAHARRLAVLNAPDVAPAFAEAEEFLVGRARTMRWADFTKALAYWLRHAREQGEPDPDKADRDHRFVALDEGLRGTGVLSGELTPTARAEVSSALERIERELFESDWAAARDEHGEAVTAADLPRTTRQRRHDALVEMARRAATAPVGGKRPRPLLSILVGYDAFRRVCELADGTVVSPTTVASELSEADIERVVADGPSRVLDLGHQRSFTGAARRAVEVTQRHCTERGCHVPGHLCQVDHVWRWADGGPTRPDNGELRCGPHNRARERPRPRRPPPRQRTDEQAGAFLDLLRERIRDRLAHDPTWAVG